VLRSYRVDDAPAVLDFFARVHAADPTVSAVEPGEWRALLAASHNHAGRDFALDEHDGELRALLTTAWLDDPRVAGGVRHFRALVHPAWRRQGLGRALLTRVEALAERDDAGVLQCVVRERWAAGRATLARAGFAPAFADVLLKAAVTAAAIPAAAPPLGVSVRGYRGAEDHAAWAALANEGFARDAASVTESAASVAGYTHAPGFGLWLAAADDGRTVGFCHVAEGRAGLGEVQGLVVTKAFEGRGVGAALLARALGDFAARGCRSVELQTELNNARAQALYARFGFVRADTLETFRRARARRASP
jgi:mycothiol synthase